MAYPNPNNLADYNLAFPNANMMGTGVQTPSPPFIPDQPAPEKLSLIARLFGGADPTGGGLLTPGQTRGLGNDALLQAGLQTMLASRGGGRALLPIAAQGILGGQTAYQKGFEQTLQNAEIANTLKQRKERDAIVAKYAGKTDPQSLTAMMSEFATRGYAKEASAISEYLKSLGSAGGGLDWQKTNQELIGFDKNGNPITRMPLGERGNNGRVFKITDAQSGVVRGIDADTGKTLWTDHITPSETKQAEREAWGQTMNLIEADKVLRNTDPPEGFLNKVIARRQMLGDAYTPEYAITDETLTPKERIFLAAAIEFGTTAGYIKSGKVLNITELKRVFNIIPTQGDVGTESYTFKERERGNLINMGIRKSGREWNRQQSKLYGNEDQSPDVTPWPENR
jgi:hypothetical protein